MTETRSYPSIPTKILLPIDFSPSSQAALEIAADLAQHFNAKLHLLTVIPFFPTTTFPNFVPEEKFLNNARARAERHLENCVSVLNARGIISATHIEVGNDVVGEIMQAVDHESIDMIIISTHGVSGWHPMIFGSIAEKVIKLVQCPLLLLRSTEPDTSGKTPSRQTFKWW